MKYTLLFLTALTTLNLSCSEEIKKEIEKQQSNILNSNIFMSKQIAFNATLISNGQDEPMVEQVKIINEELKALIRFNNKKYRELEEYEKKLKN